MPTKQEIQEKITEQIITLIEEGELKSWQSPYTSKGIARNFETGRPYSGINFITLNFSGKLPLFGTANAIKKANGTINEGAKKFPITFSRPVYKKGKIELTYDVYKTYLERGDKDLSSYWVNSLYYLISLEDTTGIKYEVPTNEGKGVEGLQEIIDGYKNPPQIVSNDQTGAYYMPSKDLVNVPFIQNMLSPERHAKTTLHELVHSTGHATRLNREGIANFDKFGSEKYSFEELVAELGAAFLCSHLNIFDELSENSAAYMKHWLGILKEKPSFIVEAAASANKAVNHILGTK